MPFRECSLLISTWPLSFLSNVGHVLSGHVLSGHVQAHYISFWCLKIADNPYSLSSDTICIELCTLPLFIVNFSSTSRCHWTLPTLLFVPIVDIAFCSHYWRHFLFTSMSPLYPFYNPIFAISFIFIFLELLRYMIGQCGYLGWRYFFLDFLAFGLLILDGRESFSVALGI